MEISTELHVLYALQNVPTSISMLTSRAAGFWIVRQYLKIGRRQKPADMKMSTMKMPAVFFSSLTSTFKELLSIIDYGNFKRGASQLKLVSLIGVQTQEQVEKNIHLTFYSSS